MNEPFPLNIGVLALQGAFAKHQEVFKALGLQAFQVRTPKDLEQCDGLVIPGGESSTIYRQMVFIDMIEPLKNFAKLKPIFGTCAGLILMSSEILNPSPVHPFGLLDVAVERNAYGRQIESFCVELEVSLPRAKKEKLESFFIRAPRIARCGPEVQVLAFYQGDPVLVQQGIHLGASFHAELAGEQFVHKYFLSIATDCKNSKV